MAYHFGIIGGGIGGLAAAIFLARAGHRVSLLERFEQPQSIGAGVLIQPSGVQVLQHLGLLDVVVAGSARIAALIGHNHRHKRIMNVHYADIWPQAYGLGVHRGLLFTELYRLATDLGVEFKTGCDIDGLAEHQQHCALVDTKGRQYAGFDALIIANGSQSTLRRHVSTRQQHIPYPWGALWAHCADEQQRFTGSLLQKYHHAQMMMGVLPTGPHPDTGVPSVSFFWSLKASDYPDWLAGDFAAWQQRLLDYWPELECLLGSMTDHHSLTFARYGDVVMQRWHHQRMVCIGDAAHAMSPQLGQGVNLALIDAWTLAQCLQTGASIEQAFAQYSQRRRRHIRYYQWASRMLTPFFQSDSRWLSSLRDIAFPWLNMPVVYKQVVRTVAGVKTGRLFDKALKLD